MCSIESSVTFCCFFLMRVSVRQPPQTVAELDDRLKLLEILEGNLEKTKSQIPLIHEQFAILDKYEVPVEYTVSVYFCVLFPSNI